MIYHSTRSRMETCSPKEALLKGLCDDGGLYVSDELGASPLLPADLVGLSYQETARAVFSRLLPDFTETELQEGIEKAYGRTFDDPAVTPLTPVGKEWLLELYHGPTSAFKDVALCMLPQFMSAALAGSGRRVMIVTATSGDTGKAALNGFQDVPGIGISVFYPHGKVSDIQYLQMATQEGRNVNVAAVEGNFDDVQSTVKRIFASGLKSELEKAGVSLSSANSINVGRLVPQVVYYFDAYRQLMARGVVKAGDPVDFSVPTGNFGDVLAGFYARRMGLPVRRFLVASNANHVLTDFLTTGVYDRNRAFVKTITPSMDILISSNLERMLYYVSGGDTDCVAGLMRDLAEKGVYRVSEKMLADIQALFSCGWADDAETKRAVREAWEDDGRLIDPHTAVALKVAREARMDDVPTVVLSTASPYKFCRDVYDAVAPEAPLAAGADGFAYMEALAKKTGVLPPKALAELREKAVLHETILTPQTMADFVKAAALREF